jgi:hypothetical protein
MKPGESIYFYQKKDGSVNTIPAKVLAVSEDGTKLKIQGNFLEENNPVRWVSIKNCELQENELTLNYEDVRRKVKGIFDLNCARTTKNNISSLASSIIYSLTKSQNKKINLGYDYQFPLVSRETLNDIKIDLSNEFGQISFV